MKVPFIIAERVTAAKKKYEDTQAAKIKAAQTAYDDALAAFEKVESEEGSAKYVRAQDAVSDARDELKAAKSGSDSELSGLMAELTAANDELKEANTQFRDFQTAIRPLAKAAGQSPKDFLAEVNKRFEADEFSPDDVPETAAEMKSWVEDNLTPTEGDGGDGEKGDGKGGGKKDGTPTGKKTAKEMEAEKVGEGETGGAATRGGGNENKEMQEKADKLGEKVGLGVGPALTEEDIDAFIQAADGTLGGEPLLTDSLKVPVIQRGVTPTEVAGFAEPPADIVQLQEAAMKEIAREKKGG